MDSHVVLVFWEAAGMAGKSKTAATPIKLRAHVPETTGTETSSNGRAPTFSPLNGKQTTPPPKRNVAAPTDSQ